VGAGPVREGRQENQLIRNKIKYGEKEGNLYQKERKKWGKRKNGDTPRGRKKSGKQKKGAKYQEEKKTRGGKEREGNLGGGETIFSRVKVKKIMSWR